MEKIELPEITGKKLVGLECDEEGYFCVLFEGGYKLKIDSDINGLYVDLVKDGNIIKYSFGGEFYEK